MKKSNGTLEPSEKVFSVRFCGSYKRELIREFSSEVHSQENSEGSSIFGVLTR
jgi:hypothetical protein